MGAALFFSVIVAMGANIPEVEAVDTRTMEYPFADSAKSWELVFFEEDGKRESRRGRLDTCPKGKRVLDIFPYAPWTIVASRVIGEGDHVTVELDLKWEGEFPGQTTIHGIYTICDNYLYFCFTDNRNPRPNRFTTTPGCKRTLLMFK
jgi:hypothetical protein